MAILDAKGGFMNFREIHENSSTHPFVQTRVGVLSKTSSMNTTTTAGKQNLASTHALRSTVRVPALSIVRIFAIIINVSGMWLGSCTL